MRHGIAILALALAAGCDSGSGFAGDYETVAFTEQQGACGGDQPAQPIAPGDQWFRLDDADTSGGLLVAFYACADLDHCDDLYDLSRSFGRAKDDPDGWAGYVSTAIPAAPCQLTYRVRRLARVAGGVTITEQVFRDSDPSLTGSACNSDTARERGETMPCVEDRTQTAEDR